MSDNSEPPPAPATPSGHLEFFIKYFSVLLPVILALIPVYSSWRSGAEAARRESQKPFLAEQLKLYLEATKVTAKLAAESEQEPSGGFARVSDPFTHQKNTQRFWELYWGELGMVEDVSVKKAMADFGECLRDPQGADCLETYQRVYSSMYPDRPKPTETSSAIRFLALNVSHACRDSLRTSFDR